MSSIKFTGEKARFILENPDCYKKLYFPLASEKGIKSVVNPYLNGDSKLDQNTFILEPVSIENLHNNKSSRNFWCIKNHDEYLSLTGVSAEAEANRFKRLSRTKVVAGFMWQKVIRYFDEADLMATITSFVPYDKNVEVMQVEITNTGSCRDTISPIAAIPLYGRSADNLRDHRHVTSLLHRIRTTENGVLVKPTLSFDERGHKKNEITYFVVGIDDEGNAPISFYPTVDEFIGESGSFLNPAVVAKDMAGISAGEKRDGMEAMGALRFKDVSLKVGETKSYTILIGATANEAEIEEIISAYSNKEKVAASLIETENYWNRQVNISVSTADRNFDNYFRWVCFQPILRRLFGCSFLPHHDYGKGGRGWRDLWQDCLALLIMNPEGVREMLLNNFAGVRIDGTNATIIGQAPGEFIADRNGITRVWMDHGVWPFITTKLYLEQTGDTALLLRDVAYFKDKQILRGEKLEEDKNKSVDKSQDKTIEKIEKYNAKAVLEKNVLYKSSGEKYLGTVLEHILLQNVLAILEVGEHGIVRLRDADWNDALDMASKRGESVAFSCAYAGNLKEIAIYVRLLGKKNEKILLLKELVELFEAVEISEKDEAQKREAFAQYLTKTATEISGEKKAIEAEKLANILENLSADMMEHIRKTQWIKDTEDTGWLNSYYDNSGNRVEYFDKNNTRMMLTGQVFSIMSGTATDEMVEKISRAADKYLYDDAIGGYRLNTDFKEEKYDMGRAFGFAYCEKENGAVFSHMTVMYANALYKRGFVREGYKALETLMRQAMNFESSNIYPGIPEYFNNRGQGLYHYLTGAASWYALTMVTEVFGVKGKDGTLVFEPKLVKEQFDDKNQAKIDFVFDKENYQVIYLNDKGLDFGQYEICSVRHEMDGDCTKIYVELGQKE